MKTFEQAAKLYEDSIRKLKASLARYAGLENATQKKVNHDQAVINNLVDFYNVTEQKILDMETRLLELQMATGQILKNTQKLNTFCSLHNIDPDMIFYYSQDELDEAWLSGVRFRPPVDPDFTSIRYDANGHTVIPDPLPELTTLPEIWEAVKSGKVTRADILKEMRTRQFIQPYTDKYLMLQHKLRTARSRQNQPKTQCQ